MNDQVIARMQAAMRCLAALLVPVLVAAASPVLAQPAVFWGSDPVLPNETAMLVGHDLSSARAVRIRRLPERGAELGRAAPFVTAEIVQAGPSSLKVVIPPGIGRGLYEYVVETSTGEVQGTLNAPDIYWTRSDRDTAASPGGQIRVFGRNLVLDGAPELRLADRRTGEGTRVPSGDSDLWSARFALPKTLAAGLYDADLVYGWGAVALGPIAVGPEQRRPQAVFNVKDFGASGNGFSDETGAFKAALQKAAQSGGGTVFVPRGRYLLADKLDIPRFTTLKGEARELVQLVWPDTGPPPSALLSGSSDFSVQDVTIYASHRGHLVVGGFENVQPGDNPGRIRLERVRIRASQYYGHLTNDDITRRLKELDAFDAHGPDAVRLRGSDVTILDCDIHASARALYLFEVSGALVARSSFTNSHGGWYSITGSNRVLLEENVISSGDSLGSGGGVNTLRTYRTSQNIVFRGNEFRSFPAWDREAFTSDGPGGFYEGAVKGWVPPRTILIDAVPAPSDVGSRGATLFIVGGRGMGQMAQVVSREGGTIQLDRDLAVAPDLTTLVTITRLQRHYLIVGNRFSDCGPAVQLYGTAVAHVVADNEVSRCSGLFSIGLWYHQFQASWYTQFLNNTIKDGASFPARGWDNHETEGSDISQAKRMPEAMLGSLSHPKGGMIQAPLVLGTIVRRNRLLGNAHIELRGGNPRDVALLCGAVVEGNTVQDADFGVRIATGTAGVFVRDNTFSRVLNPLINLSPPGARC